MGTPLRRTSLRPSPTKPIPLSERIESVDDVDEALLGEEGGDASAHSPFGGSGSHSPGKLMRRGSQTFGVHAAQNAMGFGTTFANLKTETGEVDVSATFERFQELTEQGHLDIYTCMGLSIGRKGLSLDSLRLVPKIMTVFAMQVVMPILLLFCSIESAKTHLGEDTHNRAFRVIGGMLLLYALWFIYDNSIDECRYVLIEWAVGTNLKPSYVWPVLLGEFLNVLTACILVVVLFLIFLSQSTPQDLLLNCLAINFVGSVDNEFVQEEAKDDAAKNFQDSVEDASEEAGAGIHLSWTRWALYEGAPAVINTFRVLGVVAVGHFTAFLFVFAHDEAMCKFLPWLQIIPVFCN